VGCGTAKISLLQTPVTFRERVFSTTAAIFDMNLLKLTQGFIALIYDIVSLTSTTAIFDMNLLKLTHRFITLTLIL
jgi:hypothetical protein